jgi:glutaminyl-peptide cyclotransferase
MKQYRFWMAALMGLTMLTACGDGDNKDQPATTATAEVKPQEPVKVPDFIADSAYNHIAAQVALGPRNPGSAGQKKCADWMQLQLKKYCDTVYRQQVTVKGGDGKSLPCINLIGSINPAAQQRILLLTHWDSRPWADQDTKDQDKPILAADDAASGVGVLIELVRQLKDHKLPANLGVDVLFTDVEDYGKTEWGEDSYCLGTQYWARNPHVPGYRATFGILLDMVGARGATFPMELTSQQYAPEVQQAVYQAAGRAGYSSFFPFTQGGGITDDHKFVNELAHIPTIDIINTSGVSPTGFKPHWHTHKDNMDIIDKATLKAVGQTLLQVIYEAADGAAKAQGA